MVLNNNMLEGMILKIEKYFGQLSIILVQMLIFISILKRLIVIERKINGGNMIKLKDMHKTNFTLFQEVIL